MKQIDEYYTVIENALLNLEQKNKFLYDKHTDRIFIYRFDRNNLITKFRNETLASIQMEKDVDSIYYKNKKLSEKIKFEYLNDKNNIISLKSISKIDLENFIFSYQKKIKSNKKKEIINCTKDCKLINLQIELSRIDFSESWNFGSLFGQFIKTKFKELYEPYGISEKTEIVW